MSPGTMHLAPGNSSARCRHLAHHKNLALITCMQSSTIFFNTMQFWHGGEQSNKKLGDPRASLLLTFWKFGSLCDISHPLTCLWRRLGWRRSISDLQDAGLPAWISGHFSNLWNRTNRRAVLEIKSTVQWKREKITGLPRSRKSQLCQRWGRWGCMWWWGLVWKVWKPLPVWRGMHRSREVPSVPWLEGAVEEQYQGFR